MPMISHYNYRSSENEIYCCLRNKIVALDRNQVEQFCSGCKMYEGEADGKGVTCSWDDSRNVSNPHIVQDPLLEFASNQTRQVGLVDSSYLSVSY
ncbi:hypothetical protein [Paenibacillus sp. GP183]|jgi:hypothetical protein|uniref:hypothetical protein n=1 Tax=Paenibacillus sp. GP183 TaxID=1882751 RepID=UPI00089CFFAA|nr:hypothetical protein [Paenibacillus sp. GP183]SEC57355.1 hypothetical protein SAMN05443246_4571 [Paenibacillus sp. GP183]